LPPQYVSVVKRQPIVLEGAFKSISLISEEKDELEEELRKKK
jgi:hypothetical protein